MSVVNNDLQVSQRLFNILEQSKLKIESIVDSLPDVFCIIDREGSIYRGNWQLAELLRTDQEFLIRHRVSELFSEKNWAIFSDHLEVGGDFELPADRTIGPVRTIIWSIERFSNETGAQDLDLYTVIGRDISISVTLERKNHELEHQKGRIQALINSTNFGFFTFDANLIIQEESSAKTEELFGTSPQGKNIATLLQVDEGDFKKFITLIYQPGMWEMIKSLRVRECSLGEKIIRVEFMPIFESGQVTRILGIATDVTKVKALEKRDKKRLQANLSISKILRSKALFVDVLTSVKAMGGFLGEVEKLRMAVHTLKGEFGLFECLNQVEICHDWETSWKKKKSASTGGNDANGKVTGSDLENNQAFFKKLEDEIAQFLGEYGSILNLDSDESVSLSSQALQKFLSEIKAHKTSAEVSTVLLGVLSGSLRSYLSWLNDLWLKLAASLKKEVDPIEWDDQTPLFIEPYKPLLRTLIHAIRNSIDHGIETVEERTTHNKTGKGKLKISLRKEEDYYFLTLKDNGRGVNLPRIREIAKMRGLPVPQNDAETVDLLFAPEFSSATQVTDLSGRGVGMSAIRHEARLLEGDATAETVTGEGFTVIVKFKAFKFN